MPVNEALKFFLPVDQSYKRSLTTQQSLVAVMSGGLQGIYEPRAIIVIKD